MDKLNFKLYTPEGAFVSEVTLPPFEDNPHVIIWGVRVFIFVDLYLFMDSTDADNFSPEAFKEIDTDEGCYVEVFAYQVPFTAADLAPARPAAFDRPIPVTEDQVADLCGVAPDHYVRRAIEESNPFTADPSKDKLLTDRVYVGPDHPNAPGGCSCTIAPGYHWTGCPVAVWGVAKGKAVEVYIRETQAGPFDEIAEG